MVSKAAIATTSSHSSLYNIVPGALEEGLEVYVVCYDRDWELWSQYPDLLNKINILRVNHFSDSQSTLRKLNLIENEVVIVPHGSFVRYLTVEQLKQLKHPIFGGIKILGYEGDRNKNSSLLAAAGITTPKVFKNADTIDRPVMVKLHGAEGGKGYFIAFDKVDFKKKSKDKKVNFIQEYVSGVSIYAHYFSSPLENRCELLGFDRRLESNVNSQYLASFEDPSFTVVGNVPIAVRESLIPEYHEIGRKFVEQTGLIGPFCIETICTSDPKIYAFEFSGRIVAGTTIWVPYGNTYANLLWGEPMYMGKRIAREIKKAYELDKLDLIAVDSPKLKEI
ncbi:MAG TPA: formate--phosphoribosylaminoimidazolecarboxamide ligase [candidate division Zixibacteria bacterium]|nr:formate--phosphoribosylaminoimidazolecarboxamide ligase [candidate division Zixibacteria bacterium]